MTALTIPDAIIISVFTICLTILAIKLNAGRCKHEWEEAERFGFSIKDTPTRETIVLRCKKCGALKNHEVN